ncbi:GNAT family N-acetyltransferase [Chloroflexota bacterium]
MPQIEIRPATPDDIPLLITLEHNYVSDYVWQIDLQQDEHKTSIVFRQVKLPRSVQVRYPRDPQALSEEWTKRDGVLVASMKSQIVGYACLVNNLAPKTTWVTDLVVLRRQRRQGIGTALLLASQDWAIQKKNRRIILEMQPKNYPTISLAQKLGYDLCGYNDHYFINQDIALFFSKWLS